MSNNKLTLETLESWLWDSAKILRGNTDSSDYKNYIFGLLFLKRSNDVFEEEVETIMAREGYSREEAEDDTYFQLPEESRWETIKKQTENIGIALDKAFAGIENNNTSLEGVMTATKFGDKEKLSDELLQRLLRHFNQHSLRNDHLESNDLLGDAYEYLIKMFADDAGKKGGEFYTPRGVVQLIVQLIKPEPKQKVYDPTCGSGGMLIESARYIAKQPDGKVGNNINVSLFGQEKNIGTWAIGKLNMVLHGFTDSSISKGDTLNNPQHKNEKNELMLFDRVIANPPFSIEEWWAPAEVNKEIKLDKDGNEKKIIPNYKSVVNDPFGRLTHGIPPRSYADFAFLQHMISVLKEDGLAGVVLPHGCQSRGSSEAKIRKSILESDLVEAIIGLPSSLFYNTGIPASVWILNKSKKNERKGKVIFIDASEEFVEKSNQNELSENIIKNITDAFEDENEIEKYKRIVSIDEIRDNKFNLNLSRYIDKTEEEEIVEISSIYDEIENLNKKEAELDNDINNFICQLDEIRSNDALGEMKLVSLKDCLDYVQPSKYITKSFEETGTTPVLTANKSFILGYTEEETGIYDNTPVIIFDDFTTDCKYVDFPFKVRSSALKILTPKSSNLSVKYLYEAMKTLSYQCIEHKRYWISEYQFLKIPLPNYEMQLKIADILQTVDEKSVLVNKKKKLYDKLKRGIVQKLI